MRLTVEQQRLAADNVRLVSACYNRHFSRKYAHLEDDLIGAGYVGLVRAAYDFDPGRGLRFSTLADAWVYGAMCRQRDRLAAIPLPQGWDRLCARQPMAGDAAMAFLPDTTRDHTDDHDDHDEVEHLLSLLPPTQAGVVRRHMAGRTFAEIAAERGTSPQAAQQAWASALTTLRRVAGGAA